MKKIIYLMIILVLLLMLNSCMKGEMSMHFFEDKDNRLADARMEQVFNCIKDHDDDALKKAFSQRALAETENINTEINNLFSFIQGDVISWSRDESPVVFDNVEYGKKSKQLSGWYGLETTEQTYLIFLVDYPIDTMNVENEGLYSLMIIEAADENNLTGTWDDWTIPGITVGVN